MTAVIESTAVIARPPQEVFELLLDLENAAAFDPDVATVEKATDGPIGVGTEFRFFERTPPFGKYQHTSVCYTAIDSNRRITFTVRLGAMSPTGSLSFDPDEAGTRVTFHGEMHPRGIRKLLTPLMARQGRRTWDKRLSDFKAWAERRDSPA